MLSCLVYNLSGSKLNWAFERIVYQCMGLRFLWGGESERKGLGVTCGIEINLMIFWLKMCVVCRD